MNKKIEKIKKVREFLLNQIAGLTTDQLNKIPEGYNNNIIWNLAHLICAEQSICYLRAGQPAIVNDKYISLYRTTTKPGAFTDEQEIKSIKNLLLSTVDELQINFDKKIFDNYSPSENILKIYGVELHSIEDALEFLLYHEGFHTGYIISLIRLVS
ncbi:MAG: DinB family protein [Ferruginibacter sp.]